MVNSADPDQPLRSVASNMGLHCLRMSILETLSTKGLIHELKTAFWVDCLQSSLSIHTSKFP